MADLRAWILRLLFRNPRRVDTGDRVLERVINKLDMLTVRAQDGRRRLAAQRGLAPEIYNFDRSERLTISVMSAHAPWLNTVPKTIDTPAMRYHEDAQYYTYLGSFYEGRGRAVELGPWLGASTQHIVLSLARNPKFAGEQVHVFDDFIWRKVWMDQHVPEQDQLPMHACFRHLFERHTAKVQHLLKVQRVKISDYDGNEDLPSLAWCGDPIEILYVDCGHTFEANQAWYSCLKSSFIPGRTLIVMQDWRLHREVPHKWFNQTLSFTESKGDALALVHELSSGDIATFL